LARTEFQAAVDRPQHFTIDRRLPASQQVYEDLRGKILSLELRPGEALSRPNLADSYGLSQTPVRDAFLKLEQEGLVEIYPQSRTVVTRIDVDQAREAQFLRMSIELETVRTLALDPDKQKLAPAQQILSQQRLAFLERGNLSSFSLLDGSFHLSLCTAVGHPELWDLIVLRSGHIDRLRNLNLPDPGKAATILADHAEILQALVSSNAAAAEKAVRQHLSGTLNAVEQIRERYPAYF
jgi:DNA-binding GntR family transcriptional regulator